MRIWLAILCGAAVWAQAPNTLTEREKRDGWQLLFDGKSWAGWDLHQATDGRESVWIIEDGWIRARGRDANVRRFGGDVATRELFGDFELSFEWSLPANGNSGVKYRVQGYLRPKSGAPERAKRQELAVVPEFEHAKHDWGIYPIGFEYQVYDDALAAKEPDSATGSLYSLVAPKVAGPVDLAKTHVSRIVVRGRHVEHWLDGVKVVNTDLDADAVKAALRRNLEKSKSINDAELRYDRAELAETLLNARMQASPILLQYHSTDVKFRNLKVRRLGR